MYSSPADATCVVPEQRGGAASRLLEQVSAITAVEQLLQSVAITG